MTDYTTTAAIKAALPSGAGSGAPTFGSGQDTYLATVATRVSRLFDAACGRPDNWFAAGTDSTRYFTGDGSDELWIGELAAAPTSVAVAEGGVVDSSAGTGGSYTAWTTSDYLLWPYNALADGKPYSKIMVNRYTASVVGFLTYPKGVKIVGKFGFSTTPPDNVAGACAILGAWLYKRGLAGYQTATAVAELQQLFYTGSIDPTVKLIIGQYTRVSK